MASGPQAHSKGLTFAVAQIEAERKQLRAGPLLTDSNRLLAACRFCPCPRLSCGKQQDVDSQDVPHCVRGCLLQCHLCRAFCHCGGVDDAELLAGTQHAGAAAVHFEAMWKHLNINITGKGTQVNLAQ